MPKRKRKDSDGEEDEDKGKGHVMVDDEAEEDYPVKTILDAYKATPEALFEQKRVFKGKVLCYNTEGLSFEFGPSMDKAADVTVYDIFRLMPSLSHFFTYSLVLSYPSNVLIRVKEMLDGTHSMRSEDKMVVSPDVIRTARLNKPLHAKHRGKLTEIRGPYDIYRVYDTTSHKASRVLDNYLALTSLTVRMCTLYPLHIVKRLTEMKCKALLDKAVSPDAWKLGFEGMWEFPGVVSPIRLHHIVKNDPDSDIVRYQVSEAAMFVAQFIKFPQTLWKPEKEAPLFLVGRELVVNDPEVPARCTLVPIMNVVERFRKLFDSDAFPMTEIGNLGMVSSAAVLPFDADFGELAIDLAEKDLKIGVLVPCASVKGVYESFMGTATGITEPNTVVVLAHLDTWTVRQVRDALDELERNRKNVVGLLIHGNLYESNPLMREVKKKMTWQYGAARKPDCAPWVFTDFTTPLSAMNLPPHMQFDLESDETPPRFEVCYMEEKEDNRKAFVRWYWHVWSKYVGMSRPFGVQAYVQNGKDKKEWQKLIYNTECPTRPTHAQLDHYWEGQRLIDSESRRTLLVQKVLTPQIAGFSPTLIPRSSRNVAITRGHDNWLQMRTYTPEHIGHAECCGMGYTLQQGCTMNIKMHYGQLTDATALLGSEVSIPYNLVSVVYVSPDTKPDKRHLQLVMNAMARATRAVMVYGMSREQMQEIV